MCQITLDFESRTLAMRQCERQCRRTTSPFMAGLVSNFVGLVVSCEGWTVRTDNWPIGNELLQEAPDTTDDREARQPGSPET